MSSDRRRSRRDDDRPAITLENSPRGSGDRRVKEVWREPPAADLAREPAHRYSLRGGLRHAAPRRGPFPAGELEGRIERLTLAGYVPCDSSISAASSRALRQRSRHGYATTELLHGRVAGGVASKQASRLAPRRHSFVLGRGFGNPIVYGVAGVSSDGEA